MTSSRLLAAVSFNNRVYIQNACVAHGSVLWKNKTGISRKVLRIPFGDAFSSSQRLIDSFQLCQSQRRTNICHPIIVADDREPITSVRLHALTTQKAKPLRESVVICRHHPSFTGRDDFVSVEAESCAVPQCTYYPAAIPGTVCFGRVFERASPCCFAKAKIGSQSTG